MGRGGGISSDADEIADGPSCLLLLTLEMNLQSSATVKWSEIIMAEQALAVVRAELKGSLPLA